MKIEVSVKPLESALADMAKVAGLTNTRPILACVLLEARSDKLQLSATNLRVGAKMVIDATVKKEGAVAIPIKDFLRIAKNCPGESLTLETSDSSVEIRSKMARFKLPPESPEDFPLLADRPGTGVPVEGGMLKGIFDQTYLAMSDDATRMYLCGVYLIRTDDGLRATATDGSRLNRVIYPIENLDAFDPGILVSRDGVEVFRALLPEGEISLATDANRIYAWTPRKLVYAQLLSENPPQYDRVIPNNYAGRVKLPRKGLIAALRRAVMMADEDHLPIRFNQADGHLRVTGHHGKQDKLSEDQVEILESTGDPISFIACGTYILDAAQAVEEDEVWVSFPGPLMAIVLTGHENALDLFLVMPIHPDSV